MYEHQLVHTGWWGGACKFQHNPSCPLPLCHPADLTPLSADFKSLTFRLRSGPTVQTVSFSFSVNLFATDLSHDLNSFIPGGKKAGTFTYNDGRVIDIWLMNTCGCGS